MIGPEGKRPLMLPDEVHRLLTGLPEDGEWEPVFPLLTTDPDGAPRICLLSRAELRPGPDTLHVVLRGRRASENLRRTGVAVLQAVGADTSYAIRVALGRTLTGESALAAELTITAVEADSLGIPLRPMTYQVDPSLAEAENWTGNAALFARLAALDD